MAQFDQVEGPFQSHVEPSKLHFWNTEVDSDIDLSRLSNFALIGILEELITHDIWNNGGQLIGELGKFHERVRQEIFSRMKKED